VVVGSIPGCDRLVYVVWNHPFFFTETLAMCSSTHLCQKKKLWKLLALEATPRADVVWKFQRKKIKIPFVVSCPKSLCCQKMPFGPLGVKE
jgi:hypothetical protein